MSNKSGLAAKTSAPPSTRGTPEQALIYKLRVITFILMAAVGLAIMLLPLASKKVLAFSPLWFYGLIIVCLSAYGAYCNARNMGTRATWIAYLLLFDLCLSASTRLLHRLGLSADLLPVFEYKMLGAKGFTFHPLLQMAPTPGFTDYQHRHTEFGTRSVAPPSTPQAGPPGPRVALVGGSSTYDISVAQGDTWPDRLQQKLPGFRFLNFGVPGYTTVEHIVQTAWYLPEQQVDCVVYYFGWNDIRNNNLPNLDPAFADYHLLDRGNHERTANSVAPAALLRMMELLVTLVEVYPTRPALWTKVKLQTNPDARFEAFYRRNIETLVAINRQRGTRVAFIGQLLNYPALRAQKPGLRHFGAPAIEDRYIPDIMDHFNGVTAAEAGRLGVPFLQPGQDWLVAKNYSDFGHFTPSGAEIFASKVAEFVRTSCSASAARR